MINIIHPLKWLTDIKDYDIRMCYWGNSCAGKIISDENEHYAAEYKIIINDKDNYDKIYKAITEYYWVNNLNCIGVRKIQQHHIWKVLYESIPGIFENNGNTIKKNKLF